MKTHLVPRTSLLAALAAAVLAGCGGHGQEGVSTTAPRIKTQPQSTTAALGASATFTVSASTSGAGGLTYQWYKGTSAISGATSATYTIASVTNADYGSYTVQVSNAATTTTSGIATLSVPEVGAPKITAQPQSVTVTAGAQTSFSVTATGDDLSYQWFFNGNPIDGATNATYTISTAGSNNSGTYTVRVTNANGFVTSTGATLSLVSSTVPVITTQPAANVEINQGANYKFSVVASGQAPLSYQWFKNGAPISGATGSSYTISPATSSDAGTYTVTVSNSLGSVTSSNSVLSVISPPVIVTQPTAKTVNIGDTLTLSVTATGTGLSYQWYKNNAPISGAVSSTYTATARADSAGQYFVRVTNVKGVTVQSTTVVVTVVGPPTITAQPTSVTVGAGATATFTVTATTTAGSLTYQWYKNGAEISGATGASYTTPATVAGDNNATYYVRVMNQAGTTQSDTVTLTVLQPPTITSQPQSLTVTAGQSASFTVVATSSLTPTYQWYKNGVAINGATSATYTIAAAATTDAGSYYVIVYNGGVTTAATTSSTATLTVN